MLSGFVARARSFWRGVRHRSAVDAQMDEEFRLHLELRMEDLVHAGLSREDAARRARLEFGCMETHKEEGAQERGLRRFDDMRVSVLDFKLGFRMLVRYPGLTAIGGLAIAFAIWVGAGAFEIYTQVAHPSIPLPEGDRIVALQLWDTKAQREESRTLSDFVAWRQQLTTIEDLGLQRTSQRNLIVPKAGAGPITIAEMTASGFRTARMAPLLGRTLVESDEQPGAPAVLVIGYETWQQFFSGDPNVVGRTVQLAGVQRTVVGVMPGRFAFPVSHEAWIPFVLTAPAYSVGRGPSITRIFGRLAPGASLDDAQTELTTVGRRRAADYPETHGRLRPRVMPYAQSVISLNGYESLGLASVNVFLVMLLVLVCGNVALLMFARAATRESEIVVRSALGAGRRRIIAQFFAEAMVLGAMAAVVGLVGVNYGLTWALSVIEGQTGVLPFWFRDRMSLATIGYAVLLTVLGAVIAGVVPALKVTRGLQARLRAVAAGAGGLRFGGIWTAVIVAQVAVTVTFPVTTYFVWKEVVQTRSVKVSFPSEQFLTARLAFDRDASSPGVTQASPQAAYRELERRVSEDPSVVGITFANRLPRTYHPHRIVEVDEGGAAERRPQWPNGYRVSSASVDGDFFGVLTVPIVMGRGFHAGEVAEDHRVVVVNQSFVTRVLGDRNPIGRRLRYVYFEEWGEARPDSAKGPWYEIVGVVPDMGMSTGDYDPKVSGIYHPLADSAAVSLQAAIHLRGDPEAFASKLRALAIGVDPRLRLDDIQRLDKVNGAELQFLGFWFQLTLTVSAISLLLSLAGLYAVMAFTVSRRTREIGIRVALGASRASIMRTIFRRPLMQLAFGVVLGGVMVAALTGMASDGLSPVQMMSIGAYAILMTCICLLACVVPTYRALSVQPTEALRADI